MRLPWLSALAGIAIGAATVTVSGPVRADDKADAQALFQQGNKQADKGDYAGAIESYRAAYAKYPSVKLLLNMGTVLRQLGRNAEAIATYEQYLRDPGSDPALKRQVEKSLAELDATVGTLRVEVDDPAAKVMIDGAAIAGEGGVRTMRVDPGTHTVVATKEGLPAVTQTASVAVREEKTITLSIAPKAEAAPSAPSAAPPPKDAPAVASSNGSTQRTLGLVAGGLGVVGLGVGVVFGVLAKSKDGEAGEHCRTETLCTQEGVDLGAEAQTNATIANVGLIAGGVLLAGGVVLFLASPRDTPAAPASAVRLVPVAGPGGGGAWIDGRF